MADYTVLQAQTPTALVDLLNGTIFAPKPIQTTRAAPGSAETFTGLNGLTLVFTTPAVTVTFATADEIDIVDALGEIQDQVDAVDPLFHAAFINDQSAPSSIIGKRLKMYTGTAAGLVINLATSTAAAKLGLNTTGTLTKLPVDSTKIIAGGDTISGGHYIIVTA